MGEKEGFFRNFRRMRSKESGLETWCLYGRLKTVQTHSFSGHSIGLSGTTAVFG